MSKTEMTTGSIRMRRLGRLAAVAAGMALFGLSLPAAAQKTDDKPGMASG
jgi:hypothetical protein